MMKILRLQAAMLLLGLLGIATAQANSLTLADVGVTGTGPTDWSYNLLFNNSTLKAGDFFTINDFGSATVITSPGANWTFSQALVGPNSLPAGDAAGILNATFTWTGADTAVADGTSILFTLRSPLGPEQRLVDYTSADHQTTDGRVSRVIGGVDAPTTVPLPAAAWLLFSGLAGLGFVGRRKRS